MRRVDDDDDDDDAGGHPRAVVAFVVGHDEQGDEDEDEDEDEDDRGRRPRDAVVDATPNEAAGWENAPTTSRAAIAATTAALTLLLLLLTFANRSLFAVARRVMMFH